METCQHKFHTERILAQTLYPERNRERQKSQERSSFADVLGPLSAPETEKPTRIKETFFAAEKSLFK